MFILQLLLVSLPHLVLSQGDVSEQISEHRKAAHVFGDWMRDPYIMVGPDDYYYLKGSFILKVAGKYVLFGTAWSTDQMRRGTYNLYYCTSDNLLGPYGERKFAGRFLGQGTIFKDKKDRWWCTAFYNANKPTLSGVESVTMDLSDTAYTINQQGLTLVPMEIYMNNGDVVVKAKDPYYASPGLEEVQKF